MRNILASLAVLSAFATAAPKPDSYQVTGPIIEVTDTKIVVEGKGKERHEFARSADTKVEGGELKVGTKVTVKYTMTAVSVEVKPAK
jgi:hypothetical protein